MKTLTKLYQKMVFCSNLNCLRFAYYLYLSLCFCPACIFTHPFYTFQWFHHLAKLLQLHLNCPLFSFFVSVFLFTIVFQVNLFCLCFCFGAVDTKQCLITRVEQGKSVCLCVCECVCVRCVCVCACVIKRWWLQYTLVIKHIKRLPLYKHVHSLFLALSLVR